MANLLIVIDDRRGSFAVHAVCSSHQSEMMFSKGALMLREI